MIKILFVIGQLTGGGGEKALVNLVNRLDPGKFTVTVLTVVPGGEARLKPHIRCRCLNPQNSPLRRLWLRFCAQLGWVYPLYIREDADLEVAYLESFPTKLLAAASDAVKIAWVHCDLANKTGHRKMRRWYRRYHRIVCVSRDVETSFRRYFDGDTVVLPNVLNVDEILGKSGETQAPEFDILAVGRLSREKGIDRLLTACEGLGASIGIMGDGPLRQELEAQARAMHLNATFLGHQENPYPYMAAAKLQVLPSRSEGLSTVAQEGLLLGKAMMAAPCAGMAQLLSGCALITEDFRAGMETLLNREDLRRDLENKARIRGRELAKRDPVRETEAFLLETLEKYGGQKWKST